MPAAPSISTLLGKL